MRLKNVDDCKQVISPYRRRQTLRSQARSLRLPLPPLPLPLLPLLLLLLRRVFRSRRDERVVGRQLLYDGASFAPQFGSLQVNEPTQARPGPRAHPRV
jgi:hypothetical protein